MAVAGAGGWIPSNFVYLNCENRLTMGGITQNKPPECIDPPNVAAWIVALGGIAHIDVRRGGFVKVNDIVEGIASRRCECNRGRY